MFLYHYYDASMKPFQNLSDIPIDEAKKILMNIALKKPNTHVPKEQSKTLEQSECPYGHRLSCDQTG